MALSAAWMVEAANAAGPPKGWIALTVLPVPAIGVIGVPESLGAYNARLTPSITRRGFFGREERLVAWGCPGGGAPAMRSVSRSGQRVAVSWGSRG